MKRLPVRALSFVLSLAMVLSVSPVGALAAGTDEMKHEAFSDDFSDVQETSTAWSGQYSVSEETCRIGDGQLVSIHTQQFENAVYEFDLTIQGAYWGGFLFNRSGISHTWDNSGYLLYLRSGIDGGGVSGATAGAVELLKAGGGVVQTGAVANYDSAQSVHFRVECLDGTIRVYVNNGETPLIDYTDNSPFSGGYAGFYSNGGGNGNIIIDNVKVYTEPPAQDSEAEIEAAFAELKAGIDKSAIYIDDTEISKLPAAPEGYSLTLTDSSDKTVVALDGTVTPPAADTEVTLTYTLSYEFGGETIISDTYQKTYTVQAATSREQIQHFLDNKYGMFVHYVWVGQEYVNTPWVRAIHPDGTPAMSVDEVINGFDANQFAADLDAFGVEYVILTSHHYNMNPLYPSEVFKEYRYHDSDNPTEADLIAKVYDALEPYDIDLYLYIHPHDIHDFCAHDKETFNYYGANRDECNANMDTEKWQDYIDATYREMMERYKGKIKGIFLDESFANPAVSEAMNDYARIRDAIKSVDPTVAMMANYYGSYYALDTGMLENATVWHGSNHADVNTWATSQFSSGTVFRNDASSWWAQHSITAANTPALASAEDMYKFTLFSAGQNTEGGGVAWAAGPYCGSWTDSNGQNNIWEPGVRDTMAELGSLIKPVLPTISGTVPSQSFVTAPGTRLGQVAWGSATESKDGLTTYVHVLKAPEGNTLNLGIPADGKAFSSAKIYNGAAVTLEQTAAGVIITLPDGISWDENATILELTCDPADQLGADAENAAAQLAEAPAWLYPEAASEALYQAIEAAQTVAADPNATDEMIQSANTALEAALAAWESARLTEQSGSNLAYQKTATASTTLSNSNWDIAYVTDGQGQNDTQIGWTSDPHSTVAEKVEWIQVDLGNVQTVGRIDLTPAKADGYGFPEDFCVEVSADGTTYTKIYEQTGYRSDGSELVIYCDAQNVQYIRITATKLTPDQALSGSAASYSYRMQLAEIEAYGPSVERIAYEVADIADPQPNQASIMLPAVPEGYSVLPAVESSNTAVIGTNGVITFPTEETEVTLQFTVVRESDNAQAKTRPMTVTVPGAASGGGTATMPSYTISVTQSTGGKISPSTTSVTKGSDKTFTITADEGYKIADVLVDGKSVGAVSTYTFEDVMAQHTITAKFEKVEEIVDVGAFTDVKSTDWFAEAVQYAVDEGLMNGTSGTTFSPNGATTRAMIVTILYRQAGSPKVDSDGKTWWSDAQAWAMANGISDGTNMDSAITREQLATMLYRYAELTGRDVSQSAELDDFQDASQVSGYAMEALEWAAAEGIITGKTGGVIDPQAGATRAETATMFMRFAD